MTDRPWLGMRPREATAEALASPRVDAARERLGATQVRRRTPALTARGDRHGLQKNGGPLCYIIQRFLCSGAPIVFFS